MEKLQTSWNAVPKILYSASYCLYVICDDFKRMIAWLCLNPISRTVDCLAQNKCWPTLRSLCPEMWNVRIYYISRCQNSIKSPTLSPMARKRWKFIVTCLKPHLHGPFYAVSCCMSDKQKNFLHIMKRSSRPMWTLL